MRNIEKIMYNKIVSELKKKGFVYHGKDIDFIKIELDSDRRLFLDMNTGALFSIKTVDKKSKTTWYFREKGTPELGLKEDELKDLIKELNKIG